MRAFIFVLLLSFWQPVGASVEAVDSAWAQRGNSGEEALQKVRTSITTATNLALQADNDIEKAILYNKAAVAALWVGDHVEDEDDKIHVYEMGLNLAQAGVDVLVNKADKLSPEGKRVLAEAYLNYSSNRGRWGKTRGIMKSLKWAPKMIETAQKVLALGEEEVFDYGAHRTLGRVYFKLPRFISLGDPKKAYENLKIAFDNTQYKDLNISRHGSTNLYYADSLRKTKKNLAEACRIVKTLISVKASELHPERIPETLDEQKDARAWVEEHQCE